MKQQDNIEVFLKTRKLIESNRKLRMLTSTAVEKTVILEEGFCSAKSPFYSNMKISVEEVPTLTAARKLADEDLKVAALNFANPIEPGGGVLRGANAQEEYLCRASNLWFCLISKKASSFYREHRRQQGLEEVMMASDRIIYSPEITVFREDRGYFAGEVCIPRQEYTKNWKTIDVITCAAPYFGKSAYILPQNELYAIFCKRIRNILEAAIEHEIEAIVLGAFGCGAFHNPPELVAKAFGDVLLENRYKYSFKKVVFAIKRSGLYCPNIEAFTLAFRDFPPASGTVFSP